MTKYIEKKKHNITICYDNWFFITFDKDAPEGVSEHRDDYRYVMVFNAYKFEKINSITVGIIPPAEQFVWKKITETFEEEWIHKDKILKYPRHENHYVLRKHVVNWLEENVGKCYDAWDVRTKTKFMNLSIFFKKRKDALKFYEYIDDYLRIEND